MKMRSIVLFWEMGLTNYHVHFYVHTVSQLHCSCDRGSNRVLNTDRHFESFMYLKTTDGAMF